MCDSGHMEGSACTHYNTVEGLDSTWCGGVSSDVCANCNYCYHDAWCDLTYTSTYCTGDGWQWCGETPWPTFSKTHWPTLSPTPSSGGASSDVCMSCNYCYHDGYCDSTPATETDCASYSGHQWCGQDYSDCKDAQGVSCGMCLSRDRTCLPRTVNGTGHTGPSEFCATSI